MKALVDGDLIVYRTGFSVDREYNTGEEGEKIAAWRANETVENILAETGADSFIVFLSDSGANNFRTKLYPEYKANRKQPKPTHYQFLRDYLLDEWKAEVAYEQEADDALGISQSEESVICSIDKDLLQVPGHHYNFVKKEFTYVTEDDGIRHFYRQLLSGDPTDNIPGCAGIGTVKATKALQNIDGESNLFKTVERVYRAAKGHRELSDEQLREYVVLMGRLVFIRRKEGQIWEPPENKND